MVCFKANFVLRTISIILSYFIFIETKETVRPARTITVQKGGDPANEKNLCTSLIALSTAVINAVSENHCYVI